MNWFTRKTLVGANRVRIHLLRVKPFILRVKQKYYYILMYCFTRKVNCCTRKDKCFTRKTFVTSPSNLIICLVCCSVILQFIVIVS